MNPFGRSWKERNVFGNVFCNIVGHARAGDALGIQEELDSLNEHQSQYLYWHLQSDVRRFIKDNGIEVKWPK